jgi:hypothetical protein
MNFEDIQIAMSHRLLKLLIVYLLILFSILKTLLDLKMATLQENQVDHLAL